jgi:hypothetical protein
MVLVSAIRLCHYRIVDTVEDTSTFSGLRASGFETSVLLGSYNFVSEF